MNATFRFFCEDAETGGSFKVEKGAGGIAERKEVSEVIDYYFAIAGAHEKRRGSASTCPRVGLWVLKSRELGREEWVITAIG